MIQTTPSESTVSAISDTRSVLLYAAAKEIHQHGFKAASIATILQDTGLTKGALYHHFPSKQQLGLAVVDEVIAAGMAERLLDPLRRSADGLDVLLAYMDWRIGAMTDADVRLGCPLNNLVQEMSHEDPEFRARLDHILQAWQAAIAQVLRAGQQQGRILSTVDVDASALFIVSAWEGCWGMAKIRQSAQTFRLCMAQLKAYVLGLMPR